MEETRSVTIPPLEDFLKAGAHFGHKTSKWNPKMKPYIYTEREGVHIIDLVKTMKLLKKALEAIERAGDTGSIILVGTKGQAASMVQKIAEERGAFYINNRWPGGLFTNHQMIIKSISKLISMEEQLARGAEDLVKKEQLQLSREVGRLNKLYEGIKFMDKLPSLVIVVDSKLEKNAIKEARAAGINVVALMDTNCDPDEVDFPIPANDDSIKSIKLFLDLFAEAIGKGKRSTRVISLRNDHQAKLQQLANEYAHTLEVRRQQEEIERERMKRLRSGEIKAGEVEQGASLVRVVKKSVVTKVEADTTKVMSEKEDTPVKKTAVKKSTTKSTSTKETAKPAKSLPLSESELSARTVNALESLGIKDVQELAAKTESELLEMKGVGPASLKEIKAEVKKLGK